MSTTPNRPRRVSSAVRPTKVIVKSDDVKTIINPAVIFGSWSEEMHLSLTHFAVWYQNQMGVPGFAKENGWKRTRGEWTALFQLYLALLEKEGAIATA